MPLIDLFYLPRCFVLLFFIPVLFRNLERWKKETKQSPFLLLTGKEIGYVFLSAVMVFLALGLYDLIPPI